MAAVTIHTGPIVANDPISRVTPDQWAALLSARRAFLAINLPYDCRCLLQFTEEALEMVGPLGYADVTDLLRRGLHLDPAMVQWAVEGLKHLKPTEPIPFNKAVALGQHGGDHGNQYTKAKRQDDPVILAKGNSAAYLLARLDRDRPDLAARVRAGEVKPKTAARQAGIIKTPTTLEHLYRVWRKATPEERLEFLRFATVH
jgi:hypothetical protein